MNEQIATIERALILGQRVFTFNQGENAGKESAAFDAAYRALEEIHSVLLALGENDDQ